MGKRKSKGGGFVGNVLNKAKDFVNKNKEGITTAAKGFVNENKDSISKAAKGLVDDADVESTAAPTTVDVKAATDASPPIETPVSNVGKSETVQKDDDKGKIQLNEMLQVIYLVFAVMTVTSLVAIWWMGLIDVISYSVTEANQIRSIAIDDRVLNKDTLDYKVLSYANTKSSKKEPFHVFGQEGLLAAMYVTLASAITFLCFHMGLVVCINLYFKLYKRDKTFSTIDWKICNPVIAGVLAITILYVFIADQVVYRKLFTQEARSRLVEQNGVKNGINLYACEHMAPPSAFVNAMKIKDYTGMVDAFNNTPDDTGRQKMMFSLALYTYFQDNIPESNPAFESVEKLICTIPNSRKHPSDFTGYIYYQSPNPMLDTDIFTHFAEGKVCNSGGHSANVTWANSGSMSSIITAFNKRLSKINLSTPRNYVYNYMVWMLLTTLFFVIGLLMFLYFVLPTWGRDAVNYGLTKFYENVLQPMYYYMVTVPYNKLFSHSSGSSV